jgi:hypothetical protein
MKKTAIFLTFLLITSLFISCERDEEKAVIRKTITPNTLSSLSAAAFALEMEDAAEVFQTFDWSEVDYGFEASVTYTVQLAVKGNNFAVPVTVASVNDKQEASIMVGDFNKILLDMELEPGTAADLEFRVAATINPNVDPVYSNVVEASVTPYATVFPPIYMCGAATGGWDWTKGVEMRSSAPNVYNTSAYFISNETFRFFKQPDWGPTSYNFPYFEGGSVSDLFENAMDGDLNFRFLGTTGY